MENDKNSHTDNSTTYHNDAKRGLPKLKCPWAMSNAEAREMTLNIQHGNGAVVVVCGPWIDKDSRKNGSE